MTTAVALTGLSAWFALMLLRVPVGMAMGLVGITGFGYLTGSRRVEADRQHHARREIILRVNPDVPVMGAFVSVSGISASCFRPQYFVGPGGRLGMHHRRMRRFCGDLRLVGRPTAGPFSAVAFRDAAVRLSRIPSHRLIAVGGTLGAMLRPRRAGSPAGHRKAVHRRHRCRLAGDRDAHDHIASSGRHGRIPARGTGASWRSGCWRWRDVGPALLFCRDRRLCGFFIRPSRRGGRSAPHHRRAQGKLTGKASCSRWCRRRHRRAVFTG